MAHPGSMQPEGIRQHRLSVVRKSVAWLGRSLGTQKSWLYITEHNLCCIGVQDEELKRSKYKQGGVLTPGSAMGLILAERINNAMGTFRDRNLITARHKV